jgi:hypothetical protein
MTEATLAGSAVRANMLCRDTSSRKRPILIILAITASPKLAYFFRTMNQNLVMRTRDLNEPRGDSEPMSGQFARMLFLPALPSG